MDKIIIKDLEIFCNHGVYKEEQRLGQKFVVSVEANIDLKKAAQSGELNQSVNYGDLCHEIENVMKEQNYELIETAAEKISDHILLKYEKIKSVKVLLKKPWAPIRMPLEYAAVEIERSWNTAFIALGSNMGEKKDNIRDAIRLIDENRYCKVTNSSSFFETKPVGYEEQDDFINSAIEIQTMLSPEELMKLMLEFELKLKRERIIRWGPRTIDLDIIFYEDLVTNSDFVTIPHPRMEERLFVLEPLNELCASKVHPLLKKRVSQLVDNLKNKNSEDSL